MLRARLRRSEDDLKKGNMRFEVNTWRVLLAVTFWNILWRKIFLDCEPYDLGLAGALLHNMWTSGVARAQPLPGHSMGTLRLRVASGPAQISAACSTEMQKQVQWNLRTEDTLWTGHLSLVERLSFSRRFCFKPILKTKLTLKVF